MENNPTPHGIAALSKTLSDEHLRINESLEGALTDGIACEKPDSPKELTQAADGAIQSTTLSLERQMKLAEEIMRNDREVLRVLAK